MTWDDIRREARLSVHETFSFDAAYTAPGGADPIVVKGRLHTRMVQHGDLDREGYAQVIEDVNQVVLATAEVTPVKGAKIDFGSGRVYRIDNIMPVEGQPVVACRVSPWED
jgi:hypothetical protein